MLKISLSDYKIPDCIKQSISMYSKDNDIEKCSGKGANGYLFFGQNTIMQKKVAFKYYYYGGDRQYHAEPKYLASVSSNNILKIHHAESINDEWALYITDYCKNGDLDDFLGKSNLSVKESLCIVYDILSGLCILHSNKLVHRDLKPQNILIADNSKPVIGDFGSVKVIPDGLDCIPGSGHSLLYRPPEGLIEEKYNFCSDIYQMGIVLYQVLGGV